jgi:tetratricopeptide (TPR) repeat protein
MESIANVVKQVVLWGTHAPSGFALVEYESELSRALVLEEIWERLKDTQTPLHGVSLLPQDDGRARMLALLDAQRALPTGCLVSLNGLPESDEDLAFFNLFRDRFAVFDQCLVWWFSPQTADKLIQKYRDLNRFLLVRVRVDDKDVLAWHQARFGENLSETQKRFEIALLLLSRLQERVYTTPEGDFLRPVWTDAMRDVLGEVFPDVRVDTWGDCERLVPYVEFLQEFFTAREKDRDDVAWLFNQSGYYFDIRGLYHSALPLFKEALEIRRRILGNDHPNTAGSINNMAILCKNMGDYNSALLLYKEALEIKRRVLGNDHPDTASGINNIGMLYQSKGDYISALSLLQEALVIRRHVLGNDHPDTATTINNIGVLYENMDDYDKALSLYKEALEISRRALGNDHPNTALSINNTGALYQKMGDYDSAQTLLQEALEIRRRVLGNDHPDTAQSISNMGGFYHSMGDNVSALSLLQEALEISRDVLGNDHPNTALSINNMGVLYERIGDHDSALPLLQEALDIAQRRLGDDHPLTKTIQGNVKQCQKEMS